MICPPYLTVGDSVAIIATAKKLEPGSIDGAIQLIESWGLRVLIGKHLYSSDRQFAGSDAERVADLQWAIDNPEVKAVIFARGGYGTARIVDRIDWSTLANQPKWLCGFSDLTVLHAHVNRHLDIQTLHSTMPIFFKDGVNNIGSDSLRDALFGNHAGFTWEPHSPNRHGTARAQLIGGNLSVLCSIIGTPSDPDYASKILFLEDLTEYHYHLDRMMLLLKRSGKLSKLSGLVVGQFSDMMDNPIPFGKSVEEIILDAVSEYDFPVAFNAPIGHVEGNRAVIEGRLYSLRYDVNTAILEL